MLTPPPDKALHDSEPVNKPKPPSSPNSNASAPSDPERDYIIALYDTPITQNSVSPYNLLLWHMPGEGSEERAAARADPAYVCRVVSRLELRV